MDIADALHVSPAEFYKSPTVVRPAPGLGSDDVLDQDCETLLRAYKGIRDPRKRQELLSLVLDVAAWS